MESDTLEEILENGQLNTLQFASNFTNDVSSFEKQSPNDNDLYDVDSENLDFILNQEYEFNSDSKESNDCDDIFQVDNIIDDDGDDISEIIQLNSELSNIEKSDQNEKSESNMDNDILLLENTNSTEAINEVINDLIEQVDQKLPENHHNAGNISKITIQKITDKDPIIIDKNQADKEMIVNEKLKNTQEKIIANFKLLNNQKKSIDLVPSLDNVKRLRPNILKKSRHSLPSNQKLKTMHISEILKNYQGPVVKQESVQTKVCSSTVFKTRIKQKVNIVVEKKTHLELIREYFDSNNNLIRQEKIEEKDQNDVIQTINKEKVLPNKSFKLDSIDDLSSSSSTNLNYLSDLKEKTNNDKTKKTYKLALSNRYRNQSPETPLRVKKRPIRVKRQLGQKFVIRSPPKTNNFSFSNIRFNLTPQERKKDLLVLKNGIEYEKDTNSSPKETFIDEKLVNKKIENFLVEFGNEVQKMTTQDNSARTKTCHVKIHRISDSDFEYYYEKFKNDLKKPKNKFRLGDKVFIKEKNYYLPAVVTDIQSKCKSQSSSFFNTSSSDIYYSYGCCLVFKSENYRPSNQIIYEKENFILRYDWLKANDSIMVFNFKKNRYTSAAFIASTAVINKETETYDLVVKEYRSRSTKPVPFQLVAITYDQAENILKRNLNQSLTKNSGKNPSKKFSYLNKVVDQVISESESSLSSNKRKSESEFNIETNFGESEDNESENLSELKNRRRKKRIIVKRRLFDFTKTVLTEDKSPKMHQTKIEQDASIDDSFQNGSLSNTSLVSNNSLNLTVCRAANYINSESQRKKRSSIYSNKNKT